MQAQGAAGAAYKRSEIEPTLTKVSGVLPEQERAAAAAGVAGYRCLWVLCRLRPEQKAAAAEPAARLSILA